jgi:cbb3-type cytochrome oxidase subunit 1
MVLDPINDVLICSPILSPNLNLSFIMYILSTKNGATYGFISKNELPHYPDELIIHVRYSFRIPYFIDRTS